MIKIACGDRFGRLTTIGPAPERRKGYVMWVCRCDCGKEVLVRSSDLRNGKRTSCGGCRRDAPVKDITGRRSGRLVAVERTDRKAGSSYLWRCRCDCGKYIELTTSEFNSGSRRSCGCARRLRKAEMEKKRLERKLHPKKRGKDTRLRKTPSNSKTGCAGVRQVKSGHYEATFSYGGKRRYLGTYVRLEQAIEARRQAESEWLAGQIPDT